LRNRGAVARKPGAHHSGATHTGGKDLMELVLMLSQRLRQTSVKLVSLMDKSGN
jgi:hypothetical protein